MSKNNILAIGHSVVDIIHENNQTKTRPGGIYFSVLGFLTANKINLSLLTNFTREHENFFEPVYSKINLLPEYYVPKMPVNHLYIYPNRERDEVYEYIPENIDLNRIDNLNLYGAIYINMVSGFEISLEDLENIRKNFNGIIYLDIHTLSRGVYKNNKRKFRAIPNGEKWITNADFVQVNELELKTISSDADENQIVRKFFNGGGKGFVITEGEKGVRAYYKQNGEILLERIPVKKKSNSQCVGCGDFFGASLIAEIISGKDFIKALNFASEKTQMFANGEIEF